MLLLSHLVRERRGNLLSLGEEGNKKTLVLALRHKPLSIPRFIKLLEPLFDSLSTGGQHPCLGGST